MQSSRSTWVIYFTFACAFVVSLIPLPFEYRNFRPSIVDLVLFYWILALPQRVGIGAGFSCGLLNDVLEGAYPGLSSPGLMVAALTLLLNYQRIRQFNGFQQTLLIFLILLLSSGIEQWLRNTVGIPKLPVAGLMTIFMSALLWLPLRNMLRHLRRYYEVS